MCALRRVAVIRCQLGGGETSIDDTLRGSETSIDDTLRGSETSIEGTLPSRETSIEGTLPSRETSIEGTLPGAAVDEFVAHFTLLQRLIIFILYNKGYPILKYKW
jgi:hypothetical protein